MPQLCWLGVCGYYSNKNIMKTTNRNGHASDFSCFNTKAPNFYTRMMKIDFSLKTNKLYPERPNIPAVVAWGHMRKVTHFQIILHTGALYIAAASYVYHCS